MFFNKETNLKSLMKYSNAYSNHIQKRPKTYQVMKNRNQGFKIIHFIIKSQMFYMNEIM